ncbi:histidine kinase [Paucibacter sp. APW11]|uniref:Histidine kinase n=1 Tax=Roseateles aquae TaxID=3077235 RepID=A0ABU3PED1_9BURK|nr:histidine kinase [Paucibacter sp. APW11]MDT9000899.1 histidine kinase [Paucibacter sp. APW11]
MNLLDRILARIAQPGVVLRVAALAVCLLETWSVFAALRGEKSDAYDGVLAALYSRMGGAPTDPLLVLSCFALICLFAWRFWQLARENSMDQPPTDALRRLLLLDLIAIAVTPGLAFLVTLISSLVLRLRVAFFFALAQIGLGLLLYWLLPSESQLLEQTRNESALWSGLLSLAMSMLALHGMAFGLGRMAAAEAEKRRWLQAILAEKTSGERLQAEQLRYAERMVMARELHDVMGHHLTALNLHLQLSGALLQRADTEGARQAVEKAREGAARLLADVRAAVSAERASQRIDLSAALKALAEGIASTQITLDLDEAARDLSPRAAHALLRCVQEAVTNSVRHARAMNVRVQLSVEGEAEAREVCVRVDDDGLGAPRLREGNGLKGMQERMAELGGSMKVLRYSPGFMIELRLPRHA